MLLAGPLRFASVHSSVATCTLRVAGWAILVAASLPNNVNTSRSIHLQVSFAISDMHMGKQSSQNHIATIKWASEVKLHMQHFYGLCN